MTSAPPVWSGTAGIRASYAGLVEHYIAMTHSFERFPGLREELEAFLVALPRGPVLDLGCGAGRDAALARSHGIEVVIADVTLPLLAAAARRLGTSRAVCCDALALPFRAASFAGVIASAVLLHLPRSHTATALRGIHTILMPGGRATISMKHSGQDGWRITDDFPAPRWFTYYDPREFAELCAELGFVIEDVNKSARKDWFTVKVVRSAEGPGP